MELTAFKAREMSKKACEEQIKRVEGLIEKAMIDGDLVLVLPDKLKPGTIAHLEDKGFEIGGMNVTQISWERGKISK
jgi:hypothetical protein